MADAPDGWRLPRQALLLVLLPLCVFATSGFLSLEWGTPAGPFAQPSVPNGNAESAGRVKAISAFMLFAAFSLGVLVVTWHTFRTLDGPSRRRTLIAYLVTVVAGLSIVLATRAFEATPYLDQKFACSSFALLEAPAPGAWKESDSPVEAKGDARARRAPWRLLSDDDLKPARECRNSQFRTLHRMITILGILLVFGMPAVIFGAIICLALPVVGPHQTRLDAWAQQARRLNTFLYLAAAYMISGLLFTSAQLGWVTYSIHPDDAGPVRAQISSILLHGGIANSLVIASYYLPVAVWLAKLRPAVADAVESAVPKSRPATKHADADPFAPVKIAFTILAPTLVGFASQFLGLGSS